MERKIILMVRKVLIVLLIIWMLVIFLLSNQAGEQSRGLSHKVALLLTFNNEESATQLEPIIRKVAHLTEYAVGAMLFYGILITYGPIAIKWKIGMTIAFIILFAGLDELHQKFINERNSSLLDVGIDTFGGLLGTGACYLLDAMIKIIDNKVKENI